MSNVDEDRIVECEICHCQACDSENTMTTRFIPPVTKGGKGEWLFVCDTCVLVSSISFRRGVLTDKQRAVLAKSGLYATDFNMISEKWIHDDGEIEFMWDDSVKARDGVPFKLLSVLAAVAKLGRWSPSYESRHQYLKKG
jgi:hypothetical protein